MDMKYIWEYVFIKKEPNLYLVYMMRMVKKVNRQDGAINEKENVMGTYIHGVFDGVEFREKVLNNIRKIKG